MLEVLIALLVFSLGLLGMAGLLIVSVKTNHSAYLRTQASFLAQSMADRMRANMPARLDGSLLHRLSDRATPIRAAAAAPALARMSRRATRPFGARS